MNEFVSLSPDHARRLADGIEQHEASFITPKGDGWLTPTERRYIASLLRNAATSEKLSQLAPPTQDEIADYRDLFRRELDKNMHNSSSSPSTEAHGTALRTFVDKRNAANR